MRIDRLVLTDVRRHGRLDIALSDGLTVIRGPNESGKSTVAASIAAALFLRAESEAQAVRSLRRWGAEGAPTIELTFDAGGVPGRLRKRFAGSKGATELILDEAVLTDPAAVAAQLAELTGIPSLAFWRSTADVTHAGLAPVGSDEPAIADRLQTAVSGSDRGTAAAKKKLGSIITRYRSQGNVNPGRLKVAEAELARLETAVANGDRALAALEADRAAWATARDERIELEARLAAEEAALAEAARAEELAGQLAEQQARYERNRRGAELVARDTELARIAPTTVPLARLEVVTREAEELDLDVSEIEARMDIAGDAAAGITAERGPRPWPWVGLLLAIAALAAVVTFTVQGVVAAVVLAVLVVAFVIVAMLAVRAALRARQHALAQELAASDAEGRFLSSGRDRAEHARKRAELEARLAEIGVSEVAAATALLASARAHAGELAAIEGELRGLGIDEGDARSLEVARDAAAGEVERTRHALADLGELANDAPARRRAAQGRVDRLAPERDAARSEEDQALGRVDANAVDAEQVARNAEALGLARERRDAIAHRLTVYQGTLAAIESAEQATLKTAARYLEEHAGPAIARITAGRYDRVEVDEQDLAFRVASDEAGAPVPVEALSRGTADQLYLVARLGLVRLVTMDRRPPLVLDDPFVTFDPERAERAVGIVREVAAEQGMQIILLTWSERYDAIADALIELPGPPPGGPSVSTATGAVAAPPQPPPSGPPAEASLWERLVDEGREAPG